MFVYFRFSYETVEISQLETKYVNYIWVSLIYLTLYTLAQIVRTRLI